MTRTRDFDRIAEAWLAEGPTVLADRVLDAALDEVHLTRQRRGLVPLPWRTRTMNLYAKLAVAAVAVIAVGAIGLAVLGPGSTPGTGGQASPSPSTSPSPSPSPPPALTETFTSDIHGISVGYPAGWSLRPATEPWLPGGALVQDAPSLDVIYQQEADSPFIAVASQPLAGQTLDEWVASWWDPECGDTEPTTVDGASGVIGTDCARAGVSTGGRAYLIWLYRVDDRAWFEEILATVQLSPEDAVAPSPSPQPALTETFTSDIHGISVGYPAGWLLQPATEPWLASGEPSQGEPWLDVIYKQEDDSPFIAVASQPLAGRTLDDWVASWLPLWDSRECEVTKPVTVDGASGVIGTDCTWAGVSTGGRAYLIWLYRVGDMAWFEEILSTVQLSPEDAVDAAPSSSP